MDKDYEAYHFTPTVGCLKPRAQELLTVLYWFTAGLPALVPPEVKAHPLWPANNDAFHKDSTKGHLGTSCPGRDRLWEAIEQEFGLDLRGKIK